MELCVFCGERAGSREHVIANWLDGPLNASHPVGTGMLRIGLTHRFTPAPGSAEAPREWNPRGPDLVTTNVCDGCNTGWLASLENLVKPLLTPLVLGHSSAMGSEDQQVLAMWCYKTTLLMQLVRGSGHERLIPLERYCELYKSRRPPSDTRIWLGTVNLGGNILHDVATEVQMTTLRSSMPGYLALLTLGRVLVLCGGRCREADEPMRVETRSIGKTLVALWPASIRALQWPPPEPIVALDFASLTGLI